MLRTSNASLYCRLPDGAACRDVATEEGGASSPSGTALPTRRRTPRCNGCSAVRSSARCEVDHAARCCAHPTHRCTVACRTAPRVATSPQKKEGLVLHQVLLFPRDVERPVATGAAQ